MQGYKLKRVISISCILMLVLVGCSKTSTTENAALAGDLILKENQTLIVGKITAISGNEIALALAKEVAMGSNKGESSQNNTNSGNSKYPNRGDSVTSSEGSSGKNSNSNSDDGSQKQQSKTRYELTGEEQSMLIPVGTPVTTLLGTVSTFSRIAVENTVKIVMETNDDGQEVIVEVYIVG